MKTNIDLPTVLDKMLNIHLIRTKFNSDSRNCIFNPLHKELHRGCVTSAPQPLINPSGGLSVRRSVQSGYAKLSPFIKELNLAHPFCRFPFLDPNNATTTSLFIFSFLIFHYHSVPLLHVILLTQHNRMRFANLLQGA